MSTLIVTFLVILAILLIAVLVHVFFISDHPMKKKWEQPSDLDKALFE